jgi:hypothetical protein
MINPSGPQTLGKQVQEEEETAMSATRRDSAVDAELRDALPDAPEGRKWMAVDQGDEVRLELRSHSPFGATIAHVNVPKTTGMNGLADSARGILQGN